MDKALKLMVDETPELVGQVQGIIFAATDSFYKVLAVQIDEMNFEYEGDEITVTGSFGDLQIGSNYQFAGQLKNHARFGQQFASEHYQRLDTSSAEGLVQYLSGDDFTGIGTKTAEKIVDSLGTDAIDQILDNPAVLNNLGLSEKQSATMVEQLKQSDGMERAIIALNQFGFGSALATTIYEHYENDTLEILKSDPYRMVWEIDGVSFNRIDQIVIQGGLDPLDPRRIQAGIVAAMNQATFEQGDTFIELEELGLVAKRALERNDHTRIEPELIQKALLDLVEQEIIVADDERLFMADLYYAEVGIAQRIVELNAQKGTFKRSEVERILNKVEKVQQLEYTNEQHEAMLAALTSKLFILTGGPGTGKTTIINGVVAAFQQLLSQSGLDQDKIASAIKLAAPTGRAAKRLSEATGMPAATIHRLLGISGRESLADLDLDPLEGQLLIIDEMSMVDTELFSFLLENTPNSMQVILVGDKDQLPSVGPGRVFFDLLSSGKLNYRELATIHRQDADSTIIELANDVKHGELPDNLMQRQADRSFFPAHAQQIPAAMEKIIVSWIEHGNSVRDMQILAPMYKTSAGVNQLNLLAQALFNPKSKQSRELIWREGDFEFGFRVGDKVMQKANDPEHDVFNGDIGYIKTIMFAKEVENEIKADYIEVDFDGNYVLYQRSDLMNITLAYATTIHKAQGGEYSLVILPLVQAFNRMLQRNLLYTGLTRAKDSLVLLGEPDAYRQAAETEGAKRQTMLPTRLEKALVGILPKGPSQAVRPQNEIPTPSDDINGQRGAPEAQSVNDPKEDDAVPAEVYQTKQTIGAVPTIATRLNNAIIQDQTIDPNVGMMGVSPYDFM